MKKRFFVLSSLILSFLLIFVQPLSTYGAISSDTTTTSEKEYLSDGSYYETVLTYTHNSEYLPKLRAASRQPWLSILSNPVR